MRLSFDQTTKHAIHHSVHCLIGCGIGEILGMFIASSFHWHRIERLPLAIVLAFFFGFLITYSGVRKQTKTMAEAAKITVATDTISITSMEIVDNIIEFLIPNALVVTASQPRFWWGLALALGIAFFITVPVNRYMMLRESSKSH